MKKQLNYDREIAEDILKYGDDIFALVEMDQNKYLPMHRDVSIFEHCVSVAYLSLLRARKSHRHKKIDERSLVRGALLHDFFLYDWHKHEKWHRLHGYRHPKFAYKNALKHIKKGLTLKEKDIILHHMFPLTVFPPHSLEAWIVCFADKKCANYEHKHGKSLLDLSLMFPEDYYDKKSPLIRQKSLAL